MDESPRRVDLRLTLPSESPYRELAGELARRFAEYAGAQAAAAKTLAHAVESSLGSLPATPAADLEMSAQDHELVVTANSGRASKRTICPLPD